VTIAEKYRHGKEKVFVLISLNNSTNTHDEDDNEFIYVGKIEKYFKLHGTHFNVYLFNNQLD
jgi:hypothetical protein